MNGQNQPPARTFHGNRNPQQQQTQFVSNNNGSDPVVPGSHVQGVDPQQFVGNQPGQRMTAYGQLLNTGRALTGGRQAGGTNSNIYNTIAQGRHTDWGDVTGQSNEELETQARNAAIESASQLGIAIQNSLLRRIPNSEQFKHFIGGLNHIKFPDQKNMQLVDPMGGRFHQLVLDNNAVYNQVVSRTVIQIVSMAAQFILAGRMEGQDRVNLVNSIVTEAAATTVLHEFVEWLNSGEGFSMKIQQCTPRMQAKIKRAEESYDEVRSRFSFLDGMQCPWAREIFNSSTDFINNFNPLFENAFIGQDNGFQPKSETHMDYIMNAYNVGTRPFAGNQQQQPRQGATPAEMFPELYAQVAATREQYINQASRDQMEQFKADPMNRSFDLNDIDRVPPAFADYTYDSRHRFIMSEYFKDTYKDGWLIGNWENTIRLLSHTPSPMAPRTKYPNEMDFMPNAANKVLVVKFNDEGHVIWKTIIVEDEMSSETQNRAWTNPGRVLPTMWEEQGELKTSYEPRVQTTSDRLIDGKLQRLGEMAPMEKEPNMIAASEPVDVATDAIVHSKIEGALKVFDPKVQLDAFITPLTLNRNFVLAEGSVSREAYNQFAMLVKGTSLEDYNTIVDFLKDVQMGMEGCRDGNLVGFIRRQMTDVINRYLVECRGIPDHKTPNGVFWVKLDDIFDDMAPFFKLLNENDKDTMYALGDISNNDFLKTNLQFLLPSDEALEHFNKGVDQNSLEDVLVAKASHERNLVISRDAVMITMRKDVGPMTESVVQSTESVDPRFDAIIKAAVKQGEKHFHTTPTIFVEYGRPEACPIRVVNFSDFDKSVIRTRALPYGQELVLAMPHK